MRRLKQPQLDPVAIFLTCVDSYRKVELKDLFYESLYEFTGMYEMFMHMSQTCDFRGLPIDYLPTQLTKEQWIKLYEEKLVQSVEARSLYDIIKTNTSNSKCPLCGSGTVEQVDHHLPKTRYPLLSVALLNLFPICGRCNWNKSNSIPNSPEEEPLHPYFDYTDSAEWLTASIHNGNNICFTFSTQKPINWNTLLYKRVENHFVKLKLGNLFAVEASDEFSSRIGALKKLYQTAGETALREQMKDSYESNARIYLNSWRTAMYKALWLSDWFCEGNLFK
jgi:ribosomal protein S27AE